MSTKHFVGDVIPVYIVTKGNTKILKTMAHVVEVPNLIKERQEQSWVNVVLLQPELYPTKRLTLTVKRKSGPFFFTFKQAQQWMELWWQGEVAIKKTLLSRTVTMLTTVQTMQEDDDGCDDTGTRSAANDVPLRRVG